MSLDMAGLDGLEAAMKARHEREVAAIAEVRRMVLAVEPGVPSPDDGLKMTIVLGSFNALRAEAKREWLNGLEGPGTARQGALAEQARPTGKSGPRGATGPTSPSQVKRNGASGAIAATRAASAAEAPGGFVGILRRWIGERQGGKFSTREAAEALKETLEGGAPAVQRRVESNLWYWAKTGQVEKVERGFWRATDAFGTGTRPGKAASDKKPAGTSGGWSMREQIAQEIAAKKQKEDGE